MLRPKLPWQVLAAISGMKDGNLPLVCSYAGVRLDNPVGLAAGFDKNCELLDSLSELGFGFLTVGTVMPDPRFGNPFPRLVRYEETEGIADSMGVPGKGRAYAVARLKEFDKRRRIPLFCNIGGFSAQEIAQGFFDVEPYVDAVEISLMCPNVVKPEDFNPVKLLGELIALIEKRRKPATVRVPNDVATSEALLGELIEVAVRGGIAGIKVAGGQPVTESRLGTGRGTLHGRPTAALAMENLERAVRLAGGRLSIKSNGGIFSSGDVKSRLAAGADCVDIYSAFIYRGWTVARDINRGLQVLHDS
ncbi:MAG: hypothetical protein KIT81_08130 [Alphaproteobacteria bacterium]|nr:hypothetical protein [Alphaproteobacteria bacterium]